MLEALSLLSWVVALVVVMSLGMLWYSQKMFGKLWMRLMKIDPKSVKSSKGMGPLIAQSGLLTLVMIFVLDMLLNKLAIVDVMQSVLLAMWLSLGFVVTSKYTDVLYESKRKKLFLIDAGYHSASIILAAIILTLI